MKKLLVLSGKGGTGKTTVTSAFIAFEKARYYGDCDVEAPNLHLVTRQEADGVRSSFIGSQKAFVDEERCVDCGACMAHCRFHAVEKRGKACVVNELLCEGCGVCRFVCPAEAVNMRADEAGELIRYEGREIFSTARLKMGRGNSGKLVTEVKKVLSAYQTEDALAILDGPPGTGCPVIASLSGVDLVLVVTEPTDSGLSDLKRLLKTISLSCVKAAVCVNKYDINPKQTAVILQYCEENKVPYVGNIPYDKRVLTAVNDGACVADTQSPARDAIYHIYKKIKELL